MIKQESAESNSSRLSLEYVNSVVERLKNLSNCKSTLATYHRIWKNFNSFLIRLDRRPAFWEDTALLFCAHLIDNGSMQSSTIKTYILAIKAMLKNDGYVWDDQRVLFTSITCACRLSNDRLKCRLPIKIALLEQMLFEIDRLWNGSQPYLQSMYKALFALGYYGLLRVGELNHSDYTLKAKDVHVGQNKEKILLVLYSSKTHGVYNRPQEIRITSIQHSDKHLIRHFCPFKLAREYMAMRGSYHTRG